MKKKDELSKFQSTLNAGIVFGIAGWFPSFVLGSIIGIIKGSIASLVNVMLGGMVAFAIIGMLLMLTLGYSKEK